MADYEEAKDSAAVENNPVEKSEAPRTNQRTHKERAAIWGLIVLLAISAVWQYWAKEQCKKAYAAVYEAVKNRENGELMTPEMVGEIMSPFRVLDPNGEDLARGDNFYAATYEETYSFWTPISPQRLYVYYEVTAKESKRNVVFVSTERVNHTPAVVR